MQPELIKLIASELLINEKQIARTIALFDEGATIPFISRYRKEATGGLDEVQISNIKHLADQYIEIQKRKDTIINAIKNQNKLTEELLQRIEYAAHRDTTVSGMCMQAQTQLLRNQPTLACRTIEAAIRQSSVPEEQPMLFYTAYKAWTMAGDYREAAQQINRFIRLNDSLTRTSLQNSAGMIEKEYFRERTAFYDYRLKNRRKHEFRRAQKVSPLVFKGNCGKLSRR